MELPNHHIEETIMSTTHSVLPEVVRLQVDQRLRDAEDARRRRLARRTTHRRTWPAPRLGR
jgi:hypothetical protein